MARNKQVIFSKYFSLCGQVIDFAIRYSKAKGVELRIQMLANTKHSSVGEDILIVCNKPYAEKVYSILEIDRNIAVGGLINIYKSCDEIIPKAEGFAFALLDGNENITENDIIGDRHYLELKTKSKKGDDDNVIGRKQTKRRTGLNAAFRNCFRRSF